MNEIDMRPVPEFPGYYADWFGTIYNNEKPRTLCTNKTHKNFISVYLDGKVQHVSAAKLVCMAFNGRPKEGDVVVFIDGNQDNLCAQNLKWGTRGEHNSRIYRYRIDTKSFDDKRVKKRYVQQIKSPIFRMDESLVVIDSFETLDEAAKSIDVPLNIMIDACLNSTRLCFSYWCFEMDYEKVNAKEAADVG